MIIGCILKIFVNYMQRTEKAFYLTHFVRLHLKAKTKG